MASEPEHRSVVLDGVTKRFGPLTALSGIDLEVRRGEAVALLGPNGAGKTTLIRLVAALARPSRGTVIVEGVDLADRPDLVRRRIGVISHQTMLYDDLTAGENLRFFGKLYGLPDVESRIAEALAEVGLAERRDDRFRTFSRGMKQRLAIARATLHAPSLLLLDEPFTGLDTSSRDALSDRIHALKRAERTILIVTHDLEQAIALADRFILLRRGRIIDSGKTAGMQLGEMEERYGKAAVEER